MTDDLTHEKPHVKKEGELLHIEGLEEALDSLDNLEKRMNEHGEFGSNGPWDVCREAARRYHSLGDDLRKAKPQYTLHKDDSVKQTIDKQAQIIEVLAEVIDDAVLWDGLDEHNEEAVWLKQAQKALAQVEEMKGE